MNMQLNYWDSAKVKSLNRYTNTRNKSKYSCENSSQIVDWTGYAERAYNGRGYLDSGVVGEGVYYTPEGLEGSR